MDKQKEKQLVAEAEKFLQELIDQGKLSVANAKQLSQKLQKVISQNNKNLLDSKKELSDFIKDKDEIKQFLEKDENNYSILMKAAQKVANKNQPQPQQDKVKNVGTQKTQSLFKFEKKNMIEIFKEGGDNIPENEENLYIYFEDLSKLKVEPKQVPLFTMAYFPKEKATYFYLQTKEKIDLSFAQVDYLCSNPNEIFLGIDYYSLMENCKEEKAREYKGNSMNMEKFDKIIEKMPLAKKSDLKIVVIGNDYEKYRNEVKNYCLGIKEKAKAVVTNNKDFFNEVVV